MSNTTPEADLRRAKDIRAQAKGVKHPGASQSFNDAADRLEKRAAKKMRRVARLTRKKQGSIGVRA